MSSGKAMSLNLNIRGLGQSATLAINKISRERRAAGLPVYRLGLGQSPFPVPLPVIEALRFNAHQKDYLPAEGLPELRNAVAEYHRRRDGIAIRQDDVLIGPGSKELMFLLQLAYYGELLVPSPCWVSYVPQATIIGRRVKIVPTSFATQWRITAESVERLCQEERDPRRPRILILTYPGNPDGSTYTAEELNAIAEVARKYEMVVLSDEIYGQLHHKGMHVSIARYHPEGTIISGGLSKWCGAGGWRLGTFAFPQDLHFLLEAMADVASETFTSVSAPIQYAAIRAFRIDAQIERYLWHVRRILAGLGGRVYDILVQAGIHLHRPAGAFYLFPDFSPLSEKCAQRGIFESKTLCDRLLQDTGVAILPGTVFARPAMELTARIAYVDFDGARALSASETVPIDQPLNADFIDHYCGNVVEAASRIVDWINA